MSQPGEKGGSHSENSYQGYISQGEYLDTDFFLCEFGKIRFFFFYLNHRKHGVYCPWLTPVISALGNGGMKTVKLRPA